jgi:hypothetical protein
MSCAGFQRTFYRTAALSRRPPAAFLLLALACSGPTDIVGVVDDEGPSGAADEPASNATTTTPAGDPSADDDASDDDEVVLLLAGRPVTDWPGEALEWPLSVSLGELFASARANDRRDRRLPAPWPSRRVASGFTGSSARGLASAIDGRSPELDARLLILSASDARRLLALMAPAGGPGDERAGVFRDELGDVYWVAVESEGRSFDPAECGRTRREPFECAGNGPFD